MKQSANGQKYQKQKYQPTKWPKNNNYANGLNSQSAKWPLDKSSTGQKFPKKKTSLAQPEGRVDFLAAKKLRLAF